MDFRSQSELVHIHLYFTATNYLLTNAPMDNVDN